VSGEQSAKLGAKLGARLGARPGAKLALIAGSIALFAPGALAQSSDPDRNAPPSGRFETRAETPGDRSDPDLRERVLKLTDRLASDEWAQREAAERALAIIGRDAFDVIEQILSTVDLTEEQRVRLERVCWLTFRNLERAGMGIQFPGNPDESVPARIIQTIRGFDSINVLKPNDLIVEFAGRPIGSSLDLKHAILSRRPGEQVKITIVRGGEVIEDVIQLGSYGSLDNPQPLDEAELRGAWVFRSRELRPAERAALSTGVDAEAWRSVVEAGTLSDSDFAQGALEYGATSARAPGDAAPADAGETLGHLHALRDALERRLRTSQDQRRAAQRNLRRFENDPVRAQEARQNLAEIQSQIEELSREILQVSRRIELLTNR
jgi:hypothetical protein